MGKKKWHQLPTILGFLKLTKFRQNCEKITFTIPLSDMTGFSDNWWVGLSLLHTLFVKEHNLLCDRLKQQYPDWKDDDLFDHARLINAALMAKIHIPILYESRRKKIQRFLVEYCLSLCLFWFPLMKLIVEREFKASERLTVVLDRTQWKNNNIFIITVVWRKRSLLIYWVLLEKEGRSSVKEQIALIRAVLKLLSNYELCIIGDREFHGVELAYWLKKKDRKSKKRIYFAFRERSDVYIRRSKKNQKRLQDLQITPGVKTLEKNIYVTKQKGFGRFNMLVYQKRKYGKYVGDEPWFIITNLDNPSEVIKYYKKRGGIAERTIPREPRNQHAHQAEAMFRDHKSGGYNLEGSKANIHRLTNLILLIAIAYTLSALKGKSIKNKGRDNEKNLLNYQRS